MFHLREPRAGNGSPHSHNNLFEKNTVSKSISLKMDKKITGQILDAIPSPLLMWLTDGRLRECTELTPYTSSNTSNRNSLQDHSYHI